MIFNIEIYAGDSDDIQPVEYEVLFFSLTEEVLRRNSEELFTLYRRELDTHIKHEEWIIIERKYDEYIDNQLAYFMENNVKINNELSAGSFREYLQNQLHGAPNASLIGMQVAEYEIKLKVIITENTTLTNDNLKKIDYIVGHYYIYFDYEKKGNKKQENQ